MSELSEFSSRIESIVETIKRNNPNLMQQLRVAKGAFETINNEIIALIQEKDKEVSTLRLNYDEIIGENEG